MAIAFPALVDAAEFFVDPDYAGAVKNGSSSNPWTNLEDNPTGSVWSAINGALVLGDVTVYCSARSASADSNQISRFGVNMCRTNKSAHRLTVDGMSKFNANDSSPSWIAYGGSRKMEVRYGYAIAAYIPGINQDSVTIRGFKAIGGYAAYGGQALNYWGGSHVLFENNEFTHDPTTTHGATVQFGYAWDEGGTKANGGCTDITFRNNVFHDTSGEGLYIGGSANTINPATGKVYPAHSNVLIEGNLLYNIGIRGGEGDCIDIKDGLTGVVIRNNICHHNQGGNADGIGSMSAITAEGNVIYSVAGHGIAIGTSWGSGFSGTTVQNNIIYKNSRSAIYIGSDHKNRPISNTLIRNNTIHANDVGVVVGGTDGSIINLTLKNNIVMNNNGEGIGGWGNPTYTIANNDFFGNNPNYAHPFSSSHVPTIASLNLSINPLFVNAANPAGVDGVFFTGDDGFALQAGSPVATAGEGGTYIGALPIQGTVSPPPDTTPPTAPSGLTASVASSSQINISWGASTDNVGVTGYRVFRSGVQIATVTGTAYQNVGLSASTAYTYTVKAVDAAGNQSASSSAASATTQPAGSFGAGLTGHYFNNKDFTALMRTRTDATVNFTWANGSPDPAIGGDTFSARWIGQVQALTSETHTFSVVGDDGVRLWVNNQLIINKWIDQAPTEWSGSIALTAGQKYDVRLDYYENAGGAACQLLWSTPTRAKAVIPQSQLYPPSATAPAVAIESVSTGKAYVLRTAKVDTLIYIDRTSRITSLPSALLGGVLIRTANDDRYVTVANHLTFSVTRTSTITVAHDGRATSLPTWLNDGTWTDTGKVLRRDSRTYRLFSKIVSAGNVTLGGNQQGVRVGNIANYVVIVQPVVAPAANG
jgi:hypothetical protein